MADDDLTDLARRSLELDALATDDWRASERDPALVVDGDGERVCRVAEHRGERGAHDEPEDERIARTVEWIAHARNALPVLARAYLELTEGGDDGQ